MLPKHYTNEQTGIRYTLHGDYYLPDLVFPEQEDNRPIGKWGERVPVALKQANRPSRQARQSPQKLSETAQKSCV